MRNIILFILLVFAANYCHSQTYELEIKKAEAAYGRNRFDSCVLCFNTAFQLKKPKANDLYNAAICNLSNGNPKEAFALLNKAVESGVNISKMRIDPDLEALHGQKKWRKLLAKATKAAEEEFKKTALPDEAKELAGLWEKDQYWRFRLGKAYGKNDTTTANEIWKKLHPSDSINLIQFEKIMDRIGWPTAAKVGNRGAATAFLIIDHSPREVMEKYFPLLEKAAKNGEASLSNFATMQDRILVNRGKKQIYGTQKYWDGATNKFVYFPIEDEKNINAKRKEVGLDPLPEY